MGRARNYRIEFFVQGKGWTSADEILDRYLLVDSFDKAVDVAAYEIERRMASVEAPYGSRLGDLVGFRVLETEEVGEVDDSTPLGNFRFEDVKHKYFRRGNTYLLYKTWSWPD